MNKIIILLLIVVSFSSRSYSRSDLIVNEEGITKLDSLRNTTTGICAWASNFFTPNRNGVYDIWLLFSNGADKCFLTVYNFNSICGTVFFNEEILIGENGVTKLWDNGVGSSDPECSDGIFEYEIVLKNITTNEEKTISGTISLFN